MWGGCFADHGINAGDGGFEVKLSALAEPKEVVEGEQDEKENNDPIAACRIGWTVQEMV